jgi:MoaA/NifB/PqqE/SkfB family radical SAM enzyme
MAALRYISNLFRITAVNQPPKPLAAAYMVTRNCNLNCTYCEDFGIRRNIGPATFLPFQKTLHILSRIRSISPNIILTGGEPLLHPQIETLTKYARSDLRFKQITMLSNGLLLARHTAILPLLDRLVISFDSTNHDLWNNTIESASKPAAKITENIQLAASRQKEDHFRLIINCVLNEQNLTQIPALLDFCTQVGALFSLSPQSVNNWPQYELIASNKYNDMIQNLITAKTQGAPILGSLRYLTTIRDLKPFICYPTLVPRFYPEGAMAYPCRPIEKENNGHGSQITNIADAQSWRDTIKSALNVHGQPPHICSSCFQQCYAEPSLMQRAPLHLLMELLRFPASRAGKLADYSPG